MLEQLKEILEKILPTVDMDAVTEDTRLIEDLGFDSLALIMLSMEIEEAYGFKFKKVVQFETVGDMLDFIREKID